MDYKYRHRETYKGVKIDKRAHTSADLIRKVNAKKAAIDANIVDGSIMLSAFGELFLERTKRQTVSASWYYDLCHMWQSIVRDFGDRKMEDVQPLQLQAYLDNLKASDGTIKKKYDLICQVLRYAHIHNVTKSDISLGIVRPRGTATKNGRSLTDSERLALLGALDGHRGELFCKLMLYCGLRPSEVQALTWDDIDLVGRTISVTKSLKRDGSIGPPKTSAAYRAIPIPAHLVRTILRYHHNGDNLFSHNVKWRTRMWNSIRRQTGLTANLYDLRHTYCTDLEKMGVPINIASRFMGHANINITSKIYTHASTEALEIGRNIIDNVGNQVGKTSMDGLTEPFDHGLAVMRSGVRAPYAPPKKNR